MFDNDGKLSRKSYLLMSCQGLVALIAISIINSSCTGDTTGKTGCADCPMRKRYDADPASLIARMWKWHIAYCPGWKSYLNSLPDLERKKIVEQYQ